MDNHFIRPSFVIWWALVQLPSLIWAAGESPNNPMAFRIGSGPVRISITSPGDVVWARARFDNPNGVSHVVFETEGSYDTSMYFYKNVEDARADKYIEYDDDSGSGYNAKISRMLGYPSPYYLKIQMYSSATTGTFNLTHSTYYDGPETCPGTQPCALVAASRNQPRAIQVLFLMRSIKNSLLKRTSRGQEAIDLYYAISRDLLWPAIADAQLRQQLFSLAIDLTPLMEEVLRVSVGEERGLRFSPEILAKTTELKELLLANTSKENGEALLAAYEQLEIPGHLNCPIDQILADGGYLPSTPLQLTLDRSLRYLAIKSEIIVKFAGIPPKIPTVLAGRLNTGLPAIDKIFSSRSAHGVFPIFSKTRRPAVGLDRIFKVAVDEGDDLDSLIFELSQCRHVEYVEKNKIFTTLSNDIYYPLQYAVENNLNPAADIRASEAWSIEDGDPSVVVSVIDTGIDYYHADLKNRVWGERGYDFVNDDNEALDDAGHGTHVAGIIAATRDNYFAIAGVAPQVTLLPFKVLAEDGSGTAEDVAAAIIDSSFANADVINLSLGGDYSSLIEDALRYAHENGCLIVAAAGNDGVDGVIFPANSAYTVSVGATDDQNLRTYFSNFGEKLDLMAPGEDILSTFMDGLTCYGSGTSMATPHVAGVSALLISRTGPSFSGDIRNILFSTAADLGENGYDEGFGWGLVDAYAALAYAAPQLLADFDWSPSAPVAGESVRFYDTSTGAPRSWEWDFDGDGNPDSTEQNPTFSFIPAGVHSVTLTACNGDICGTRNQPISVGLPPLPSPGTYQLISTDRRFEKNRPTVVLIHGLQSRDFSPTELWSCVRHCNVDKPAGQLISERLKKDGIDANILQFVWHDAGQVLLIPSYDEYLPARSMAYNAGMFLAKELDERLDGTTYEESIHFVGHSLGTVVGAYAASRFLEKAVNVGLPQKGSAQFTALDRPHHVIRLGFWPWEESIYGYDENFFAGVLQGIISSGRALRIDNYYVDHDLLGYHYGKDYSFTGVGDKASGPVYNHNTNSGRGLLNSHEVGGRYFSDERKSEKVLNDHSGVHQWFRWTSDPNEIESRIDPGLNPARVCHGETFYPPERLNPSLDPCNKGWYWSVVGPHSEDFPPINGQDLDTSIGPLDLFAIVNYGCGSGLGGLFDCAGTPSPFSTAKIVIPDNAVFLTFFYRFVNSAVEDIYAAILIDDVPVWVLASNAAGTEKSLTSGMIPIGGLAGSRDLTIALYGVEESNAELLVSDFRLVTTGSDVGCTTATALCLSQNRFTVEVSWRDFEGNTGAGQVVPYRSDDSGLFWFFDSENWEMLVKVLDGCGVNGRFWVFSAATTTVEYTLRVTDTETGVVKEYFNPLGRAASAITDSDAFASCSAGTNSIDSRARPAADESVDSVDTIERFSLSQQSSARTRVAGNCTADSNSLCLNDERFKVGVSWKDFHGNTGSARVVPYGSEDSGLFWFFDEDNWEMLVKILNGCALNSRYWVFSAATTNIEYTLRITDTETGVVREYFNPLGNASVAIGDTSAFATCP